MKKCNGIHCRCMEKDCPNTHYSDCVEHNEDLKILRRADKLQSAVNAFQNLDEEQQMQFIEVLNK